MSRRGLWIVASWASLFTAFFVVHALLWLDGRSALALEAWGWMLKPVGNIVHILTIPGWLLTRLLRDAWGGADVIESVLSCAIGAAFVVVVILWLLRIRQALSQPQTEPETQGATPEGAGESMSRRRMLTDGLLLGTGVATGAVIVDAACFSPGRLRLQRYEIPIADLPAGFDGMRFVQLTDTHLGPRVPREFIEHAIDLALAQRPDVFLLTGDYVHSGPAWIEPAAAMFRRLVASGQPVLGVLGNHDWYNGAATMKRELESAGVVVIDNDRVFLSKRGTGVIVSPNAEAGSLCIAGFGDLREDHIDPDAALGGVHPAIPRLVLAHNPDSAEEASVASRGSRRIDLMISGHTHGGQVRMPGIGTGAAVLSRFGDKYASGLVEGPMCRVLISNGIGISLVPLRFLVPPEVVEITLRRAAPPDLEHKLGRV